MTDNSTLTTRQRCFIVALLETATLRDAAEIAGVAESTAWRYIASPDACAQKSASAPLA